MRAQFCAATLFLANVGNLIIAPQIVGFLSDSFAPSGVADGESLRLAMLCLVPTGLWAVWHYFRLGPADRAGPGARNGDPARLGRERPQGGAQVAQPGLEITPLVDALAVDRAAHLLGTRRVHAPVGPVELDAGRLEHEAAEIQHAPDAALEVVDDILVLDAQHATRQDRVPVIHEAHVH